MKKFFSKILVVLFVLTLIPTFVFASDDEVVEEKKEPIKIYEFYGSTCGYCASLNNWFDSIEKEYGDYFDLVKYEVWSSEENHELMEKVAEAFDDSLDGVPYLVIGDFTANGYSADDNEILLQHIISEYEKDVEDRDTTVEDVIKQVEGENKAPNGLVVFGVVAVITIVVVIVVIKAREE